MAGNTVGAIQITVQANTGRLKATMVKDGTEAAKATKTAMNKELAGLTAKIKEIDGTEQARIARTQMEAILRGIPVNLSFAEAQASLNAWEEDNELRKLLMGVKLSETDLAKIKTDWIGFKEELEAYVVALQVEADTEEAIAASAAAIAEIEAQEIKFHTTIDTILMKAEVRRAIEEAERQEAEIKVHWDMQKALLDAQIDAEIAQLQDEEVAITLALESAMAQAELAKFLHGNKSISVELDLLIQQATAAFNAWLARQEERGIDVDVDVETLRATLNFKRWVAEMQATKIDVPVDVKTPKLPTGGDAGGFDLGALDVFSGRMKAILTGIVALAEPATTALAGLASAGIALVGSASIAAVSGVTALGAAVGGLAFVGGAGVLAFQGMSDAVGAVGDEFTAAANEGRAFNIQADDVQEALAGLAPEARDFAVAMGSIVSEFSRIGDEVQGEVFAGLADNLHNLAQTALPEIEDALVSAGGSLNTFFGNLIDTIAGMDFGDIFAALKPAVDALLQSVVELVGTLEPFLLAAAPAARELSEWLLAGAEALRGFTENGLADGSINEFLSGGIDSLKLWGEAIGATVGALGTLFAAGKEAGDQLVGMFSGSIQSFDTWMQSLEGENALAEFFELGITTIEAFGPIVDGLSEGLANIVTPEAVDRMVELAEGIGDVLPALGELFDLVGRSRALLTVVDLINMIGDVIEDQAPKFEKFADIIGESLSESVELVRPIIEKIGEALGDLAEDFGRIEESVKPVQQELIPLFGEALEIALDVIVAVVDGLADFIEKMEPLIDLIAGFVEGSAAWVAVLGDVIEKLEWIGSFSFTGGLTAGLALFGGSFDDIDAKMTPVVGKFGEVGEGALGAGIAFGAAAPSATELAGTLTHLFNIFKGGTEFVSDFREEARLIGQLDAQPVVTLGEYVSALGDELDSSAEKADTMRTALDKLLDPVMNEQEALDALAQNVHDLGKAFKDNGDSLDASTEKGRENREQVRQNVTGMLDYAEAAKAAGKTNEEIAAGVSLMRDQLIDQVDAFDTGTLSAEEYVNQLGLTPQAIETIINTPGMAEALIGSDDLSTNMDDLNGKTATPKVDYVEIALARQETRELFRALDELPDTTVSVDIPGLDTQIVKVGKLRLELDKIDGSTVSASVIINANTRFEALGGYAQEGFTNIAGEAGPEWATFRNGSRALLGQATIVPAGTLLRPAQNAELVGTGGGIDKQVNVTMNVYPAAADPRAVATSVINRVAVLAGR